MLGVDRSAPLPEYHARSARSRLKRLGTSAHPASVDGGRSAQASARTTGRVALFATCYGNRNEPALDEDLVAVFEHNGIEMTLLPRERCCGMPRLELGDLEAVAKLKEANIPQLAQAVAAGYDLVAPIPSCVLMFKQELPLMYPDDAQVQQVAARMFDPFEYLMLRHEAGLLRTDFKAQLGKVSYHVPCHLRVQNLGLKTRDVLKLVPGTTVDVIERCSGHNGTYGVKKEFRAASVKIGRPVAQRVESAQGRPLQQRLSDGRTPDRERPQRAARARAPAEAAAARLRDLRRGRRMDKLSRHRSDAARAVRARAAGISHPRAASTSALRQLAVGPHATWLFEDRLTVQYQVQEMLRTERIFEPAGHRRGARRLQPADPRRQQLEGDAAARVRTQPSGRPRSRA